MELYTPNGLGFQRCYIGTYPPGCGQIPGVHCYRDSENSRLKQMWCSIYSAAPAYSGAAIFTILIYWTTRRPSEYDRNSPQQSPRNEKTIPCLWIHVFQQVYLDLMYSTPNTKIHARYYSRRVGTNHSSHSSGGRGVLASTRGFHSSHLCSATLCPSLTFMTRRDSLWWVLKETIFGAP
jgi:hypothetical protein